MNDLKVKWFGNPADRFIQLLKTHDWNDAVKISKKELKDKDVVCIR